jgi:hypothetical protein
MRYTTFQELSLLSLQMIEGLILREIILFFLIFDTSGEGWDRTQGLLNTRLVG